MNEADENQSKETRTSACFASGTIASNEGNDIQEQIDSAYDKIIERLELFEREASGWTVSNVMDLNLLTASYNPLAASSHIPTPDYIAGSRAIVNIENFDTDNCFSYCIAAHIHPAQDHKYRPSHYTRYLRELNMDGISYPVPIKQVSKFERQNENIAVNVLSWDEDDRTIVPIYSTNFRNREHIVNLFLISQTDTDGNSKHHYTLVNHLSRLLNRFGNSRNKSYPCPYCLHRFTSQILLDNHITNCSTHPPCRITMPNSLRNRFNEPNNILKFHQVQKTFPVPFVIYLDFESYITSDENVHIPSGFCALRVSNVEKYNNNSPYIYSGEGVMNKFFEHLDKESREINKILNSNRAMRALTPTEDKRHREAEQCFVCDEEFSASNHKVYHHCHITSDYLGPACNRCNLNLRYRRASENALDRRYLIPVICHNSKNYDSHIILKNLKKEFIKREINVRANSSEKFTSFEIDNFIFLDSCQFLSASLSNLVETLKKNGIENFKYLKRHYTNPEEFAMLVRKGVFPYEYLSDLSKFEEEQLPPIEAFYDRLNDETVSSDSYEHAKNVWRKFKCRKFQDYHDLYLLTDVLLLADIFENFREFSLFHYHLDPAHFTTMASLSWAAALKMTKVKLELLSDIDQLLFFERGLRGGVATISNRYAKANNPYMGHKFNPSEPTSYLHFVDANSLYGSVMTEKLPVSNFKWISDVDNFDIMAIDPEGPKGYVLSVDLKYPQHLHDEHNDYPLAAEKLTPTYEMLSDHQRYLKEKRHINATSKKLIPNLYDKKEYITHIKNLQYYIQKGLIVEKVHKILEFQQEAWLRPYIEFNIKQRQDATTAVEKNNFKLMINTIYGKTCENSRSYKDLRIVENGMRANTLVSKPNYAGFQKINEDLVAVRMRKVNINWRTPTYSGMVILELSKLVMYKFHYDVIKRQYGERASLLLTDTDSLLYNIHTEDIYKDMSLQSHHYDTSDYPPTHECYSEKNKKKLGCFKDECNGVPAVEFVGLRSKMYSLLLNEKGESKLCAKGIKSSFIKRKLRHQSYLDCLRNETTSMATFYNIQSKNHTLKTVEMTKTCLSSYDDKRFIEKGVDKTFAFGHYKLM